MKVIKRDGRAVDYDREKIRIAIDKANQEVRPRERAKWFFHQMKPILEK